MSSTEQKNRDEWLSAIEKRLLENYARKFFGMNQCFVRADGAPFRPFVFPEPVDHALAIEYAEDGEAASKNLFEDGDRFYLSDYVSPDDMFRDMVKEIDR